MTSNEEEEMTSNEEENKCPLCAEEMDWTDQLFKPCQCGYQVCIWCWHRMMDMAEKVTEAKCPMCRTVYEKEKIMAMQENSESTISEIANRKAKPPKAKPNDKLKANEVQKDLTSVRVIQRKIAYVVGLPLSLADEDLLEGKKYFGQYGKVTKVSLYRQAGGPVKQFFHDTCSVYVRYSKEAEALLCIQSVDGFYLEDRLLRASFGTAKYCHGWLKKSCTNSACLYLHALATDEDTIGKDDIAAFETRSRVQEIVGAANTRLGKRSGSVLPPPTVVETCRSIDKTCSVPCAERGVIDGPRKMTTSVDNVEQDKYNSSLPGKDGTIPQHRRISNLSSDLSSVTVDEDVRKGDPFALYKVPSTKHIDGVLEDGLNDSRVNRNPRKKNHDGGASLPVKSVDMELSNDAYQEMNFQRAAKSDRVYRNSNSFSNEEIVEHLRRIDNDDNNMTNIEENPALNAMKNSIISNIMSIDFSSCDDSLAMPSSLSELLDEPSNGLSGSSWSSFNSDQSVYSFAKQNGFASQIVESACLGYGEKRDQYLCKPQYPVTRTHNFTPLGSSCPVQSRDTPGFSSSGHGLVSTSLSSTNMLQQSTGFNSSLGDNDFNRPTVPQQNFSSGHDQHGNEHLHGMDGVPTQRW